MRGFSACLVGSSMLLVACAGDLPDQVSFGADADLFRGPAHCDWQDTWFIRIESDEIAALGGEDATPGHMFVRNPEVVPEYRFEGTADIERQVPSDAALLREAQDLELWYSPSDPNYIFLIEGERTEAWVKASEWGLCE